MKNERVDLIVVRYFSKGLARRHSLSADGTFESRFEL